MKKFANILLSLAMLVCGCSTLPVDQSNVSTVDLPIRLTGTSLNGIVASFEIMEYVSGTGYIRGAVILNNSGEQARTIRMFDLFYLHLAIEDEKGQPIPILDSIGAVNPITREYTVGPAGKLEVPFALRVPEFFRVQHGAYRLFFIYDVRLCGASPLGGTPFIRWSSGSVPLDFTAGGN